MLQPSAKAHQQTLVSHTPRPDRDARREALLEAAAAEFNARGVSRASVSRIAKAKGLTRAAVYYYVRDRDDLVFQVYRKSCEVMAGDLETARDAGDDGLSKIAAFIRLSLDPRRPPVAVLTEIDYLKGKAREAITAAYLRNVEQLRRIIRGGVTDGSLRTCDDEVIAQTLFGLIAWTPVSEDWVAGEDSSYRARSVEALVDLVANGEAADPAYVFEPPVSIADFFPAAPLPFDRAAVAAAKVEHLLMTASQVFNRRGLDGVSLEEIVAGLGATKGALYHYLDNKTDLIVRCQERATDIYERIADTADQLGDNGLEKAFTGLYLLVQAQASGLSPLIQMDGSQALPERARKALMKRNRALQQHYEGFGELGLRDGSFRSLDYAAVSQLGAGAFEWLPKWFEPGDPRAADALTREILDLFARGLRRR